MWLYYENQFIFTFFYIYIYIYFYLLFKVTFMLFLSIISLIFFVGEIKAACPMEYKVSPLPPATLFTVDDNELSFSDSVTLQSLAGSIAKEVSPILYRSGNVQYETWLDEIKMKTSILINDTYTDRPGDLIDHLLVTYTASTVITGLVTYANVSDSISLSHAVTYCSGSQGLVVVLATDAVAYSSKYSLPVVFDAEYDTLPDSLQFSDHSIVFQQPDAQPFLIEYAVFSDSPYLSWNDVSRDTHLTRLSDASSSCAAAYGWVSDEGSYVSYLANYGIFAHASDWALDMVSLSNIHVPIPPLPQTPSDVPTDKAVHTVTFVMTDGDNLQWLLGSFLQDSWYGSSAMSTTPMGFTLSPALIDVSPTSLAYIYSRARGDTSMVAAPSGLGYTYPELLSSEELNSYANSTSVYMADTQMRILNILAGNDVTTDDTLQSSSSPFLCYSNIDAVFYYTYGSGYAGGGGKSMRDESTGKPIITARFSLWGEGTDTATSPMLGNDAMVAALKEQVKDLNSVDGYSLIPVHAWTHTTADVAYIIEQLAAQDPSVEVVTPAVFLSRFIDHTIS